MIYSAKLSGKIIKHIFLNRLKGNYKFPYVLMLEPLFKCNLNCKGCGRVREYRDILNKRLSLEECMDAAKQAGAPVVSITGGEPLLHPQIKEIINSLLEKKYFVYLCTNGLLLKDFLDEIKPANKLSLVVHIDGLSKNHDSLSGQRDVFFKAMEGITKAVRLNFKVRTNTTIYKNSDIKEILNLFSFLMKTGVQSIMVSPAFSYEQVENELFLNKLDTHKIFKEIYNNLNGTKIYNTPLYWEFLTGKRTLQCTPWANPAFNPKGWKSPCYLITDCHYSTYSEFLKNTDWEKYGTGKDPRCENCMMHSGFEASSIMSIGINDLPKLIKWSFTGRIK